jgi:hypothetical protein
MSCFAKSIAASILALFAALLAGCTTAPACTICVDNKNLIAENKHDQPARNIRLFSQKQQPNLFQCARASLMANPIMLGKLDVRRRSLRKALEYSRLQVIDGDIRARHAVVLIGGIHDSYHYFDNWVTALASGENLVLGWKHDHRAMRMARASKLLSQDLAKLHAAGVTGITIVAHSIGGLVAKGAIDELSRTGRAQTFQRLDLHAFGSPWGGFAVVNLALKMPGSVALSTALGYPMAHELRPGSSYLASLARPMPGNGALHLYVGNADSTALPVRSITRRRYAVIEANAATITTIEGAAHSDYNQTPSLAALVKKAHASQCLETRCGLMLNGQRCADYLATALQSLRRH